MSARDSARHALVIVELTIVMADCRRSTVIAI